MEAGRVTPASVADHVTPHRGDYTAFRLGALRSLCAACHNRLDSANNAPRYPRCARTAPRPTHAIPGTSAHRNGAANAAMGANVTARLGGASGPGPARVRPLA